MRPGDHHAGNGGVVLPNIGREIHHPAKAAAFPFNNRMIQDVAEEPRDPGMIEGIVLHEEPAFPQIWRIILPPHIESKQRPPRLPISFPEIVFQEYGLGPMATPGRTRGSGQVEKPAIPDRVTLIHRAGDLAIRDAGVQARCHLLTASPHYARDAVARSWR